MWRRKMLRNFAWFHHVGNDMTHSIAHPPNFCGGPLGLQDVCQEYTFENVSIGFANLTNVYIDTKISIV